MYLKVTVAALSGSFFVAILGDVFVDVICVAFVKS